MKIVSRGIPAFLMMTVLPNLAVAADPYFDIGVGLPEIGHIRGGLIINERYSVEAIASNIVFNWMLGVGASGYLFGWVDGSAPPPQTLWVNGNILFNIVEPSLTGSGDTLGTAFTGHIGYALHTELGFLVRLGGGVIVTPTSDGLEAGPTFKLGVGWRFEDI